MTVNRKFTDNKIFQAVIVVVGIVLIVNLVRDIRRLLRVSDQIKLTEKKVQDLEKENRDLSEKKQYYQSPEFIEEQARDKLNMARPGETIVILPPNQTQNVSSEQTPKENLPNWRKWWNLFF